MSKCLAILTVLFLVAPIVSFAQETNEEEGVKKKKVNLIFRLDYGLKNPLSLKTNYLYKGEYLSNSNGEWSWLEEERTAFPNANVPGYTFTQTNIKFDLLLSLTEQLNIGLSYNAVPYSETINVDPTSGWTSRRFYFFFAIAGVVDYNYELPWVKNLIVNPSVSIGSHQNDYLFGASGKNFYYDLRLALAYRLLDRLDLRLWSSYTSFKYREKKESEIFTGRDRIEKIDINTINGGFGLAYRFFIYPD